MKRSGRRWIDLLILLLYVALSLLLSAPLPLHMDTHIAGRQVDTRVFQWNNWWLKYALSNRHSPFTTDRFYYPIGASLAGHNMNWVSSALSIPLDMLVGPAMAYNLLFLLTLFGSAFAMYLLVRYLTGRRDAAFLAGLVFGFFPYHLTGNWDGQMNLANIQWLPLFILFLLRTVDRKRLWDAVWCGVFLALAGLDCWFFPPFLALWSLIWLPCSLVVDRPKWNGRLVALLGLSVLISALLVAPFLWAIVAPPQPPPPTEADEASAVGSPPRTTPAEDSRHGGGVLGDALAYYAEFKSTDLLAFVVPSSDHPFLPPYAASAYRRFAHWRPAFLGYSVLALALYAAIRAGRRALPWTLSGLLFAALSLGTELRVNGVAYPGVPLPFQGLVALWPGFKLIRQASRFNVMVGLSLALLAGWACADLLARVERRAGEALRSVRLTSPLRRPKAASLLVTVVLSAVIGWEYLALPCPLLPAGVSPWYEALAQEPGDFAIVELPLGQLFSGRSLHGQTVHGKRLVNGYVARAASDVSPFVLSSGLLKALYVRMEPDPALYDLPAEIGLLAANDVRYIVLHKTPVPPHPAVEADVLASWRRTLGPDPIYEDGEIVVYATQPAPGQSGEPIHPLGEGLALTALHARRTGFAGKQFLTVDLTWVALQDVARDLDLTLSLVDDGGARMASGQWQVSPHFSTADWPPGVVVAERYALPINPALPGARYALEVGVHDATTAEALGAATVQIGLEDQAGPLSPGGVDIPFQADVTFGDQMWLLGYGWQVEGHRLKLDLAWQALDVMGANYKVFVHLVHEDLVREDLVREEGASPGEIVAQVDTMPRGWSYPTTLWSRQEIFYDRIEMSVRDVAPGRYRVALGVYRPETGRLRAIDGEGRPIADDRLVLDETIVVPAP